ncbi:tetratricopeptide repeat protein [Actinoplanes sp. NPDC024001]|uniref:tetratricopeptide repeat protein n=1 Tax=Actinoplanes sp. NPDC024001 TaxID=3154598 RepID=UPI0033D6CF5C
MTACLRHAGREAEIDTALPQWRRAWEDACVREKANRAEPPPAADPPPVARRPRRLLWRPAAVLVVLAMLTTLAAAAARPPTPAPMTGLFNILVMPFAGLPALETTLARELGRWAQDEPIITVRGPADVDRVPLERAAAEHGADVVLTGRLATAGESWTMTIDVLVTDRVFAETPEFVGHHEISLTEPAGVIRGNIEVNRQLVGDAVRYVQAVVAFVRGLGRYALDDYPGAERDFRTADRGLSTITDTIRAEVVLLMLGNALGRTTRYAEAAQTYRRALQERPEYARATVGLAEVLRVSHRDDPAELRQASTLYQRALDRHEGPLLEMKARLGLGLTYQSLSVIKAGNLWTEADAQFTRVLQANGAAELHGEAERQSTRLAAEARAGQALAAWVAGRNAEAAIAYEEALGMLSRIQVDRPSLRERELIFLHNLRDVYRAMDATAESEDVEARIRRAGGKP